MALEALAELFVQALRLCQKAGLVKVGRRVDRWHEDKGQRQHPAVRKVRIHRKLGDGTE